MNKESPAEPQSALPLYDPPFPGFGPFDCEALRRLLRRITNPAPRVAEIGSWLGDGSTRIIIEELRGGPGELYCVDTWRGTSGVERHSVIAEEYDVLGTFRRAVRRAGGEDIVRMMVMDSVDAAKIVADHAFDLVFIDGDHRYDATRRDIEVWKSKIAPGGILCGHDCESRVTPENRARFKAAVDLDAIRTTGQIFEVYHPGVILAVDEAFGADVHLFAEETLELSDGSRGPSTVWSVTVQ